MFKFLTASLSRRLIAAFLVQALVLIAAVGWLTYSKAKDSLEKDAFSKLQAVAELKKTLVHSYFEEREIDAKLLGGSEDVHRAFQTLDAYDEKGGGDPTGSFDVSSEEFFAVAKVLDGYFSSYLEAGGYEDILLICKQHGHVMYSVHRKDDLGTNLRTGFLKDSQLTKLWRRTGSDHKIHLSDIAFYQPSGKAAAFVAAPITDETGDTGAVLMLQLDVDEINVMMENSVGLGESGETYLVGEDFLMRSESRFGDGSTLLEQKVDTVATREALADGSGARIIESYRGFPVLSSYSHVGLNEDLGTDFEWAIVSEIGEAEAFAAARSMGIRFLLVGTVLTVLAALVGYLAARSISRPLEGLLEKVVRIGAGDLTVTVAADARADEIGALRRSFADMLGVLRQQTTKIQEGASGLAVSTIEIASTSSQLAASAAETSTAVSEIATTVEQVRHTATLANAKGQEIAERAAALAKTAESGQNATSEAEAGMSQINDEMQCVAESIMKLSEQTQGIGEIIGAVNDLADQSNLLSVNASIEAAKAGEFGKGFAVVAQEVKTLADQSREATGHVKTILDDIQKAASAAVMATERGNKAVAEGVVMSSKAGESIVELAEGVKESVQIATHMSASSNEQLVGIGQLAEALKGIKEATRQNLDGAKQLDGAGTSLKQLSNDLKDLATRFTV